MLSLQIAFNVDVFSCTGNLIYMADTQKISSHIAWLRVDSTGTGPISRPVPSLLPRTPVWSAPMWAQAAHGSAVLHSKADRSSAHSSRRVALRNLKQLMSQLSSCAGKSSLSLNTCSLLIAPFAMSFNITKAANVFNGIFAPLCACF